MSPRRSARWPWHRQQGVSLLEVLLLLVLVAAVVALGIANLRSSLFVQRATDDAAMLAWADQSVAGFAATHGRLPCPASVPNGSEQCAGGHAKGWLPMATLTADGAGEMPGLGNMRYLVYRGGDDLAAQPLINGFHPIGLVNDAYVFDTINELDLCAIMSSAAAATPSSADAHVVEPGSGSIRSIAYAVVAPGQGDADGDGSLFDGINAGAAHRVEHPGRERRVDYDDKVRARDFGTLQQALSCTMSMNSLHAMALAVDAVQEVSDQKSAIRTTAIILSTVNGVITLVQVVQAVMAGVTAGTAGTVMGAAVSALAGAIAGCIFLVGCALIAPYTAAVVSAGVAIGLAAAAIAQYAAAAAMAAVAMAKTISVAIAAGGGDDVEEPDWEEFVQTICGQVPELEASANARQAALVSAQNALVQAQNRYDQEWNFLLGFGATYDPGGHHTPGLEETYRDRGEVHLAALDVRTRVQDELRQKQDHLADLNAALTLTQNNLANETDPIRIAYLTDSVAAIQGRITQTQQEIVVLQGQLLQAQLAEINARLEHDAARATILSTYNPAFPMDIVLGVRLDEFWGAQRRLFDARELIALREVERDAANEALAEGRAACEAAQEMLANGATPGGSEMGIWGGARAILEAADEKGAVR